MPSAYIALGTNIPFNGLSGLALLLQAVPALEAARFQTLARSSVWQTEAWPPDSGQADYFNAVVEIDPGSVEPQRLYEALRGVEAQFGRERRERWAARTLDLDIVAMGNFVGVFGEVVLPHPRMHERPFVLAPLAEIAPNWRHPTLGANVGELLSATGGQTRLKRVAPLCTSAP